MSWDEIDEAHRAYYGFCLGPCDHESCREEHRTDERHELGEPIA